MHATVDLIDGAPRRGELPRRPTRVLVADDEYLVALEIVAQLASCGYTVVGPVGTGEEAVRLARSAAPDLALLDVRMPGGGGIRAAKTLFDELHIPVVMLSAYTDAETVADATAAGVFAYLMKPSRDHQLRATIEVAWGRYREFLDQNTAAANAHRRLQERKIIERAKWTLVQRAGVDEPTAMRLLEQHARAHQERLVQVAERVIQGGRLPPTGGAEGDSKPE